MNLSRKLVGDDGIDHTLTIDSRFTGKGGGLHCHGEMAFAPPVMSVMAGMEMAFVQDYEFGRNECRLELAPDSFRDHAH
jgi:hypothetical protein